jgi:hypothetical protein
MFRDCPMADQVLEAHARGLSAAGIDFMILDSSNLEGPDNPVQNEVLQLRPIEVIFEQFQRLHDRGVKVPKLAVLARITNTTYDKTGVYNDYLKLMEKHPNIVFNVKKNGNPTLKPPGPIIFIRALDPNMAIVNRINHQGKFYAGLMWALDKHYAHNGVWHHISPCYSTTEQKFHTSVIGIDRECHMQIVNSPWGRQLTVSPSYQTQYASLPNQGIRIWSTCWFDSEKTICKCFQTQARLCDVFEFQRTDFTATEATCIQLPCRSFYGT